MAIVIVIASSVLQHSTIDMINPTGRVLNLNSWETTRTLLQSTAGDFNNYNAINIIVIIFASYKRPHKHLNTECRPLGYPISGV